MQPAGEVDDAGCGFGERRLIDGERDAQMAGTAFAETFARHGDDVFFVQQSRGECLARQSGLRTSTMMNMPPSGMRADNARRLGQAGNEGAGALCDRPRSSGRLPGNDG